jgi:hypothetical protein
MERKDVCASRSQLGRAAHRRGEKLGAAGRLVHPAPRSQIGTTIFCLSPHVQVGRALIGRDIGISKPQCSTAAPVSPLTAQVEEGVDITAHTRVVRVSTAQQGFGSESRDVGVEADRTITAHADRLQWLERYLLHVATHQLCPASCIHRCSVPLDVVIVVHDGDPQVRPVDLGPGRVKQVGRARGLEIARRVSPPDRARASELVHSATGLLVVIEDVGPVLELLMTAS